MQVFISHDFKDNRLARTLANTLRKDGFEVWDSSQILPGDNFAKITAQALEESEAMIVLITPNSAKSHNISNEIGYALGKKEYKGRLIPVITANYKEFNSIEIPWILKRFQTIRVPNLEKNRNGLKKISQTLKLKM